MASEGFRAVGDKAYTALALVVSNFLTGEVEDEWISANLEESVEISRESGYRQRRGHALYYWGAKMCARGEAEASREVLLEGSTILGEIGDPTSVPGTEV